MKRERSFVKQSGGKSRMMEEERRGDSNNGSTGQAVGARLYFNYTAGCARASSNLVGPLTVPFSVHLSFSTSAPPSWPPSASSGFAGQPWYTTETRTNKSKEAPRTAHRFSPFDRASSRSFLVFPPPFSSHSQGTTFASTRLEKRTNGKKGQKKNGSSKQ